MCHLGYLVDYAGLCSVSIQNILIIVDSLQCKIVHESTYVIILFTVTVYFNCVKLLYIIITYMYCVYGLLIFEIIFIPHQYVRAVSLKH